MPFKLFDLTTYSENQINYVNIFLILFSFTVAYIIPFELFLFAYAVLGPLHYLTEISWLHNKNYFIKKKWDVVLLVIACVVLSSGLFINSKTFQFFAPILICCSFAYALFILLFENFVIKLAMVVLTGVLVLATNIGKAPWFYVTFAVFLPTIVHIFVFTGAFMLSGTMKTNALSGYIAFVIYLLCAFAYFIMPEIAGFNYSISAIGQQFYELFALMNVYIAKYFHLGSVSTLQDVFFSKTGIAIMRFIAFGYTYHYLNWFSKTSIIKWHQIPKMRLIIITILWLFSVGLYAYDYKVGFIALYLLSMVHVFLEFPLNYLSFYNIYTNTRKLFR